MKQRKLASILAVTMSFELMVSPIIPMAVANNSSNTKTPPTTSVKTEKDSAGRDRPVDPQARAAEVINTTAENIGTAIQTMGNIWKEVNPYGSANAQMSAQMSGDMAKLQQQQSPQPDKFFNSQKLMQIPGLGNYLALNNINPAILDCKTLPTTLHDAKPEVCRVGITGDKGAPPQAQMNQMFTYYNQYFQVSKLYKNFRADSNAEGQAFGVGCMNNAMNILNGFFKYRVDELDKLQTNLKAMQDQFKKASRSDLDAIEEATAVLEGDSPLADRVRSKRPDLFDFEKRFNNPACSSMFAGDKLNEMGRAGGLNQINVDLKKTLSAKNGKFSGESYAKSHTSVLEDLDGLADKVSKQLELNFSVLSKNPETYGKFLADLPDLVSSPNGTNRALSPDLFSDVRTKFNDSFIKLNEQRSTILSELRGAGISGDAAGNLLGNANSNNFDSEVVSIENNLKNKCFQDALGDFDKSKMLDKIYDPTASSHANQFASNFIKDKLSKILDNNESSLDKKLQELKALEAQNGGRYYMKMENAYEVQEIDDNGNVKTTVVGASTVRTPSVFFTDLIKNCNAQFKANKLDNKMSGASAIQKLRQLNQDYKNLAKSQAADMKKEVRRKLIECSSPEEANNSTPGSCTPERFNTSSPGFCANAALSCSKNMQACTQQAEGYVKEIKDQRTARVNNYKALVEKNKQDVVKIFDTALASYMKDGEMLRGLFGAGFSSPGDIKREIENDDRRKYLSEFSDATSRSVDGKLLLEDPEAFFDMFKGNIAALKESVKKQQDQILGGDATGQGMRTPGLLAQHIKKTDDNYKEVIREADQIANTCIQKHDMAVQQAEQQRAKQQEDYQKKMTELGEKRQEFCDMYGMVRENPAAMCGEVQASFVKDSLRGVVAAPGGAGNNPEYKAAARENVAKLSQYCSQVGNFNETKRGGPVEAAVICGNIAKYVTSEISNHTTEIPKFQKLCEERNDIRSNKCTSNSSDNKTGGRSDCPALASISDDIEKIYGDLKSTGKTPSITLEDAPAYCSAGDNSTTRWPKVLENGARTFNQALKAGSAQ